MPYNNPQISTTYARDRADDFDAARRALVGRKFTEVDGLRLRDLIRLQTVPASSAKISEVRVPDLKDQPRDEDGYLEPTYAVPKGYIWTPETGCITDAEFDKAADVAIKEVSAGRRHCYLGEARPKATDFTDNQWEEFER